MTVFVLTRHFLLVVCDENDPECENFFPQCLHKKGFSPVWMRSCSCEKINKIGRLINKLF